MRRHRSSRSACLISTKLLGRRRTTGETSARPWAGGPKPKLAAHDEGLRARVMSKPDATLAELQAWLIKEHGTKVSVGCLWKGFGVSG
jgi:transposase